MNRKTFIGTLLGAAASAMCVRPGKTEATPDSVSGKGSTPSVKGTNAFTTTLASFAMPDIGSSVTVFMDSTAWIAPSWRENINHVYIQGAGYFASWVIVSRNHAVLRNIGSDGNICAGSIIPAGSLVVPAAPSGHAG